ncbi:MAG TPA: Gfo/Idh/MocA family oxidoreductase [Chloroflexota bacterium]|nr:Gfo/Idh/MocA family oxidoreductase [Chloroflexota bacterium]
MNTTNHGMVRLAMIGTGGWGTHGHLAAYKKSPYAQLVAAADISPQNLSAAATQYGIPATYADYREMLEREALDAVDISTPNNTHCAASLDVIAHGINVICEKPLGMNRHEARRMAAAAREAGVKTAVNFTYRNVPAARFVKEIIDSGELGEIFHVVATYNQGWLVDPNAPRVWRLDKAVTGTGVLGDLGSHLIDLARFWVGDLAAVSGQLKTFVHQRPLPGGGELAPVDVDDAASFQVEFANGGTGTFFTTRNAFARANTQRAEVYGSKGGLVYDNERPNEIQFAIGSFMAAQRQYCTLPVPRRIVETSSTTMQTFVEDLAKGTSTSATFDDGVACQEVLDAIEESAISKSWIKLPME